MAAKKRSEPPKGSKRPLEGLSSFHELSDAELDAEVKDALATLKAAVEGVLSFDMLMLVTNMHLIARGYRPARDGGRFLVIPPEKASGPPRRPMKFSEALAAEADAWFQNEGLKNVSQRKTQ
jgi:hypothetical protein